MDKAHSKGPRLRLRHHMRQVSGEEIQLTRHRRNRNGLCLRHRIQDCRVVTSRWLCPSFDFSKAGHAKRKARGRVHWVPGAPLTGVRPRGSSRGGAAGLGTKQLSLSGVRLGLQARLRSIKSAVDFRSSTISASALRCVSR
eukprot:scaffold193_cov255-Pinguiococcus_pyrenoidosus.AAC.3